MDDYFEKPCFLAATPLNFLNSLEHTKVKEWTRSDNEF